MPLLVSSEPYTEIIDSTEAFLSKYPNLKAEAEKLKSVTARDVPSTGLLYVNQREYAVVSEQNGNIRVIGSEDVTTCHIVVIRHSGTGVTGLAHCDGCDTERGLRSMIHIINTLSESSSNGRLEVTLMGGFNDDKKQSEKLSLEIIAFIAGDWSQDAYTVVQNGVFFSKTQFSPVKMDVHVHLSDINYFNKEFCSHAVKICIWSVLASHVSRQRYHYKWGYNSVLKNGKTFPVIYGIAVDLKSGDIYPATFVDKGPEIDVRSACHFGGCTELVNIYDSKQHHLVIGPYTWHPMERVDVWLQAPDHVIRKYLSTSPEQEPPYFESHVRASLKVLADHPDPSHTLFPDGKAHRYKMNADGIWVKVTDVS